MVWTVAASMVAAVAAPGAGAAGPASVPAGKQLKTVFVELSHPPLADLSVTDAKVQAGKIAKEQADFQKAAKQAGIKLQEKFAYSKLFNGFSLTVSAADLAALARMPGVQNLYPVIALERPELSTSTDMIRAPEVVADGYDGTGVKVAVIDTGIDYNHPDLGGCFGSGCRVVAGFDFVGDEYMGPDTHMPRPDSDPMDQNGHGTHVAGIIGARAASEQGVTGVAPGVTFLAYKVFGPDGPTSSDVMVAAMEAALEDGADVVNMSIGAAFQWPQYPSAVAADRLVQRGVVVSVSAGNSGANGLIAGGAPSVASRVLAVASYENSHMTVLKANLSNSTEAGYGIMTFSPAPDGASREVVAVPNLGNSDNDYAGINVAGKVALISRGADTFGNKVARAMRFGAAAAIIHNNSAGFFAGTLGTPDNGGTPWIPALSLSLEDGTAMRNALSAGGVQVAFTSEAKTVGNPLGGQVSTFSSWGPSPTLELKPDLGAPGGMIYSTYPLALGGYASLSGTSMAAPHAAGAAALVLDANPGLRAEQVHDILRNTAVPQDYASTHLLAPVNRQGAGMIDVRAAVSTPVRISPAKISLGETETGSSRSVTLTLTNMTRQAVTYTLDSQSALTAFSAYPNAQTVQMASADIVTTTGVPTITVGPNRTARVTVTITPPQGTQGDLYGGYIRFSNDAGFPALRVPFMGYLGDYQADSLLPFNIYEFPWLAELSDDGFLYKMDAMTLNPLTGKQAYVLFNLARQASKVRLTARSVSSRGRPGYRVYDLRWVGRNASEAEFDYLTWDGRDAQGRMVPQGEYILEFEVLRPMGDARNPAHWDTWESGPITITYR
jgi:minor extracellular serine protease Vpr